MNMPGRRLYPAKAIDEESGDQANSKTRWLPRAEVDTLVRPPLGGAV